MSPMISFPGSVSGTTEAPAVPDTGFLLTKQPLDGDSTANNIIAITQSLEELKNGSSEFKGFSVSVSMIAL